MSEDPINFIATCSFNNKELAIFKLRTFVRGTYVNAITAWRGEVKKSFKQGQLYHVKMDVDRIDKEDKRVFGTLTSVTKWG